VGSLALDDRGPGEAQLYDAFGQFSGRLHVRIMRSAPQGVQSVHLALDSAGEPIAAWRDDLEVLHSVRGGANGALPRASRDTLIPHYRRVEPDSEFAEGNEFSSDPQGDTVFSYISGGFEKKSKVMTMTSLDGRPFGAPRAIADAGPEHDHPIQMVSSNHTDDADADLLAASGAATSTPVVGLPGQGKPLTIGRFGFRSR